MKYCFFDSDITDMNPFAEYDIVGEQYKQLIKICCVYSDYLSFTFMNDNVKLIDELEPYIISDNSLEFDYSVNYSIELELKPYKQYYRVCKEVCDILLKHTDRIFSWICGGGYNNPEDIAFYRTDKTPFFYSIIHEGVCVILPNDNENVECIISNPLWIPETELKDGYWGAYLGFC